jgi:hypothetical protein
VTRRLASKAPTVGLKDQNILGCNSGEATPASLDTNGGVSLRPPMASTWLERLPSLYSPHLRPHRLCVTSVWRRLVARNAAAWLVLLSWTNASAAPPPPQATVVPGGGRRASRRPAGARGDREGTPHVHDFSLFWQKKGTCKLHVKNSESPADTIRF